MAREINYTITGDTTTDEFILAFTCNSENDPRFKFHVGDIVVVEKAHPLNTNKVGQVSQIRWMRNGYPEPLFHGYWFPCIFLEPIDGSKGGGEISDNCLRLATEFEIEKAMKNHDRNQG